MTGQGIGWRFPPTNGGSEDGFIDAGMEHFAGARLDSLTREVIQNSLDARASKDHPVVVSFEAHDFRGGDLKDLGLPDLRKAVGKCLDGVEDAEDAAFELKRMKKLLDGPRLSFLRIADSNTHGLEGRNWHALVKEKGKSVKPGATPGGKYGIGKNAPFVVSGLRTVYYWSRFKDKSGQAVERCQGKSVLMSHDGGAEGTTQGTGFFGLTDGCREMTGSAIPGCLVKASGVNRELGTHLWVAGFDRAKGWQWLVAQSVIANFFCAIVREQLEVVIDVEEGAGAPDCDIRADNIEEWFTFLGELQEVGEMPGAGQQALEDARAFLRLINSGRARETEDALLGHCLLHIEVGESLGRKVGLVRNTGMLITTEQDRLKRFPGVRGFIAVCLFEASKGNEWLRKMENPKHDQFEPDRLRDDERRTGRAALNRIAKWIRAEIKNAAGLAPVTHVSPIDELAKLLPDHLPGDDDAFGKSDASERHPGPDGDVVIRLKPVPPPKDPDDGAGHGSDEGSGDEEGTEGGGGGDGEGGGDGRGGDGDGEGGTGTKGGGKARKPIELLDPRYIASSSDERLFHISFKPSESAERAAIVVHEEGDSDIIQRPDLRVVLPDGTTEELKNHRTRLVADERVRLELRGKTSVRNRAWRVRANVPKPSDSA